MTQPVRLPRERGGFVLALVVMMLFAISVAAATGYLVVNSEFAMARVMHVYAMREILRNRLLSAVVPHYQKYTQSANARTSEAAVSRNAGRSYTYTRLRALTAALRAKGATAVVVAMPVPNDYELDPGLLRLAARGEIRLVDMRHVQGIGPGSYLDAMHLNKRGQQVLSRSLARVLESQRGTSLTVAR